MNSLDDNSSGVTLDPHELPPSVLEEIDAHFSYDDDTAWQVEDELREDAAAGKVA